MIYILYLWTVVGLTGKSDRYLVERYDWRPIGEYASEQHCKDAMKALAIPAEKKGRCVPTGR